MNKYIIAIVKAFLFVFVYAVAAFIINKYEYLVALKDIDNLVGMVPVVLILIFTIGATYLLFAKHTKTNSHITITIAALVVIAVALFPTALRGNWWINPLT
ncbi:MAG: hypothetical protein RR324_04770, partial [Cellulosilyticaceae bacterium]